MITITGKYNRAKVFADVLEETAREQIQTLCEQEFAEGSAIRIMPDVHAGAGCTIGTTMTIRDKIVPNLVGVDIGCGMETVTLKETHLEVQKLDKLIRAAIPSGKNVRKQPHRYYDEIDLELLRCKDAVNLQRAALSLGTLGGGNHFIEVNKDDIGKLYIVIHSGSRHLGRQVADYYQMQAYRQTGDGVPKALAFVSGSLFDDYLHDMKIIQRFALLNRKAMMDEIVRGMKLHVADEFTTIHNYIDTDAMILRKGAVSAKKGERLLIPLNMRDGSLICEGKGNEDWNRSAPHGAGRLMSRSLARSSFTLSEFKRQMEGIYTTCLHKDTLDECPMAYKAMDSIVGQIHPTAEIKQQIKPIYNFKAAE